MHANIKMLAMILMYLCVCFDCLPSQHFVFCFDDFFLQALGSTKNIHGC